MLCNVTNPVYRKNHVTSILQMVVNIVTTELWRITTLFIVLSELSIKIQFPACMKANKLNTVKGEKTIKYITEKQM